MKKFLKIIGYIFLGLVVLVLLGVGWMFFSAWRASSNNMSQLGAEAPSLTVEGRTFRDLNKNGKLDVYEDSRAKIEDRVNDLVSQMTLEEKAGTMFINMMRTSQNGGVSELPDFSNPLSLMLPANSEEIVLKKMNNFNIPQTPTPAAHAKWYNSVQKLAERTRLGIPLTIATDPRNHFTSNNEMANIMSGSFSSWPEPTGLAAIGDSVLTQEFANIARQEYRAVGITLALHPMADLATEPRWSRVNGTFGEDAKLSSKMVYAYIKGFQGDSVNTQSVLCMTKHFSGGGPQKEGLDPHFQFQKGQVYPGKNFNYHLLPFEAAFRAGTAQIMPYYGVPLGQTSEDVGFSFNKEIITGLLREKYHFDGVVCTDWALLTDVKNLFINFPAKAHGVMHLSIEERMLKILNAGVDQFGGEMIPEVLVKLVKDGKVTEERLNISVKRILRDKFKIGLFENPYVDEAKAVEIVGRKDFVEKGLEAMRRSVVLLKNGDKAPVLPLKQTFKIYVEGMSKEAVAKYATVVGKPEDADFAIVRVATPYQPRKGFIESLFHDGDLDFKGERKQHLLDILSKVPTVVDIYLERPAVIPEISEKCAALVGNFGCKEEPLLDVLFGKHKPEGKLPFELPRSMEAVRNQFEDMPHDSKDPLYPFGFGLAYSTTDTPERKIEVEKIK